MTAVAKVAELAEQVRGVSYEKEDASTTSRPGYLPVLRAGNITDSGLTFDDLVFVPAGRIGGKQKIRRNDVIIAASSGSLDVVGKAARALADFEGGFGAFCKVLRPGPRVDPSYFAHFFRTTSYRQRVSALAAGVNINNLRNEHLDDMEIPLPPLSEQQRIAQILDKADALRAKRRNALAQLDTLTQSIFLQMFGDPATNPKGWPKRALGDLISAGPQNGLYKPGSEYGSGTPILRIDAFYDGVVTSLATLKRVRVSDDERALYGLHPGEIVVNRVNSREYLGKSALIPSLREPTVFESNMMRFDVDRARLDPGYLIQFLQTQYVRAHILRSAKDAVNQSSINQQDIKALSVLVPPLAMQRRFVQLAALTDQSRGAHIASLNALESLFSSLQQRAFRGEL